MRARTESLQLNVAGAPSPLKEALKELSKSFPSIGSKGLKVKFKKISEPGVCRASRSKGEALIEYERPNMALRAVGSLMSGLVAEGKSLEEKSPFTTFGIMLDCSRNAVMTVEHFEGWLEKLALLGYNMAMLYTEDTYELPDEPLFGFMRGAYTKAELKRIDAFAAKLGIEMIPCIQTLGHLEQILSWGAYGGVRDTGSVLLVDEERTYKLIDKMVAHWSGVFRSKRIHVGMDETHDLGRGRFYDLHGDERHFDIFNRHLSKVVDICEGHGVKPMIWSDMYFRMGSKTMHYYDKDCVIPKDVAKSIPEKAELVYWDYYHAGKDFYLDWIERHRKLGHEPLMGSGVWTWMKFWHDRELTEKNGGACIEACREAGLKEIFFTMWGDNGGYCDFDSALAGLAHVAELSFSGKAGTDSIAARFKAATGSCYEAVSEASKIESAFLTPERVLWEDPLQLIQLANERRKDKAALKKGAKSYGELAAQLGKFKAGSVGGGDLRLPLLLAKALSAKIALADEVLDAYKTKDLKRLAKARAMIPGIVRKVEAFASGFRKMWLRNNKPFGLEVMQIRFAGQTARLKELSARLGELVKGKIASIPELDANAPSKPLDAHWHGGGYRGAASGSVIF